MSTNAAIEREKRTPSLFPRLNALFLTCETRQVKRELEILYSLLFALKPRSFVEIGVLEGGTFRVFADTLCNDTGPTIAVGVDLPRKGVDLKDRQERLSSCADYVTLVEADSTLRPTYDRVVRALSNDGGDGWTDFLFIDGCHDEPVVRSDWDTYRHIVRNGGIVAFHDIQEGYRQSKPTRAGKVFRDIDGKKFKKTAILGSSNWGGIGLVYV